MPASQWAMCYNLEKQHIKLLKEHILLFLLLLLLFLLLLLLGLKKDRQNFSKYMHLKLSFFLLFFILCPCVFQDVGQVQCKGSQTGDELEEADSLRGDHSSSTSHGNRWRRGRVCQGQCLKGQTSQWHWTLSPWGAQAQWTGIYGF